jgi:hypothetical protein
MTRLKLWRTKNWGGDLFLNLTGRKFHSFLQSFDCGKK